MGPFVDTVRTTTTPLTSFEERGITYLATTNARWLPYLADEGIRFVHYPANRVRRQFRLDQDILDDLSSLIEFLLPLDHSYGMLPLSSGVSVLLRLLSQAHRERAFVVLLCTDTGRL